MLLFSPQGSRWDSHWFQVLTCSLDVGPDDKTSNLKDKIASRYFPKGDVDVSETKQARGVPYDWSLSQYHPIGTCAIGDCELLDGKKRDSTIWLPCGVSPSLKQLARV